METVLSCLERLVAGSARREDAIRELRRECEVLRHGGPSGPKRPREPEQGAEEDSATQDDPATQEATAVQETKNPDPYDQETRDRIDRKIGQVVQSHAEANAGFDESTNVRFRPVALEGMDRLMAGPYMYHYYEIVEANTNARRHFWLFGEYHLISDCTGTTTLPEWIVDLIRPHPTIVVDVFSELQYQYENGPSMGERRISHIDDIKTSFRACLAVTKTACPLRNNARFHYVDTRMLGEPLTVVMFHIWTVVVRVNVPDGDALSAVNTWVDDNGLPDLLKTEFAKSAGDTGLWLRQRMAEWDRNGRLSKQRTAHVDPTNPILARGIDWVIRHRMWRYIAQCERSLPIARKADLVGNIEACSMDYYTLFRSNGRFPLDARKRFQIVSNAIIYTGGYHTETYVAVMRILAKLRHIRIDRHETRMDESHNCVAIDTGRMRVLVPAEGEPDAFLPHERKTAVAMTRVPIRVKHFTFRDITAFSYTQFDDHELGRSQNVWVFETSGRPDEAKDVQTWAQTVTDRRILLTIWSTRDYSPAFGVLGVFPWDSIELIAEAWQTCIDSQFDRSGDSSALNAVCAAVCRRPSRHRRKTQLTAYMFQIMYDRDRWMRDFVHVFAAYMVRSAVNTLPAAVTVRAHFEAEIYAVDITKEGMPEQYYLDGFRRIIRQFVDYAACLLAVNRLAPFPYERDVALVARPGSAAILDALLRLLALRKEITITGHVMRQRDKVVRMDTEGMSLISEAKLSLAARKTAPSKIPSLS